MNGIPNRIAHTPKTPLVVPQRVIERVMTKALRGSEDGCHISLYSTASHGYAQVGWHDESGRRVTLAHRVAWIGEHGPIPYGMTIDHICKTKRCVNVAHLRLLSNYENARRTDGRDWPLGECVNGHSNDHLEIFSDGRMHCSICAQAWKSRPRPISREPRVRQSKVKVAPAPKTHCRNGHAKTPENSYVRPNGRRECLPCKVAHAQAWHGANAA